MELVFFLYAAAVGAAVGSFLNVCVYRWPAGMSVFQPSRSFCPSCNDPILLRDNLPVLGWLLLRGRCRACNVWISPQYPLVEGVVAAIWLAAALQFGLSVEALRGALFLTLLLGIALTDARHMVIPDQFSLGGAAAGVLLAFAASGIGWAESLVGAVVGYGVFWLVMVLGEKAFGKPALGLGDVHMMAMVGAFLGSIGVFLTIFLGSVLGILVALPSAWLRGRGAFGSYLPFGVFLAVGAAVAYFWGDPIVTWYRVYARI